MHCMLRGLSGPFQKLSWRRQREFQKLKYNFNFFCDIHVVFIIGWIFQWVTLLCYWQTKLVTITLFATGSHCQDMLLQKEIWMSFFFQFVKPIRFWKNSQFQTIINYCYEILTCHLIANFSCMGKLKPCYVVLSGIL